MKKNMFLLGGALIIGLGVVATMVTHEIKQKKKEKSKEKEHMYKINYGYNECFGYDCEDYNCKEDADESLDILDDYHNYSKE